MNYELMRVKSGKMVIQKIDDLKSEGYTENQINNLKKQLRKILLSLIDFPNQEIYNKVARGGCL